MRVYKTFFAEHIVRDPVPSAHGIIPGYLVLPTEPKPDIPSHYSFGFCAVLVGKEKEGENPNIRIEVFSPSGMLIGKGESTPESGQINQVTSNLDGLVSAFIAMDLRNFPFVELGDYTFRLTVGDKTVEEKLRVTAVKRNGTNTSN